MMMKQKLLHHAIKSNGVWRARAGPRRFCLWYVWHHTGKMGGYLNLHTHLAKQGVWPFQMWYAKYCGISAKWSKVKKSDLRAAALLRRWRDGSGFKMSQEGAGMDSWAFDWLKTDHISPRYGHIIPG